MKVETVTKIYLSVLLPQLRLVRRPWFAIDRRRRVNAGGNVFAFYRSRWLHCPSLSFARWAGLGFLMHEVGMFGIWTSSRCLFFSIARWGCSARFVNAMGRSVDLDLPSCVAKAGMRHARHAAWSTWPPCIVIYIDLPKNPKFGQR